MKITRKRVGIVALTALGLWAGASIANGYVQTMPSSTKVVVTPAPTPEPPLLDQINEVRAKVGKAPLIEDARLSAAAREKAQDMINRGYKAHQLDGEYAFKFLKQHISAYRNGGENLAWCQTKDSERVEDWVKSPSHYAGMTGDHTLWGSATIHNDKDGCDYTVNYFVKPL